MKTVRTTCPYCGVGCGIRAKVTGERSVEIAGDTEHPANAGRLCSKGTHLGETVGLEGRLLRPMIGDAPVGWDRALDHVAERLKATIAEHGADAVGFYVSGQLLTEDYYAVNKLAKGFVGTGNIDTNSRLCMASAVAAHTRAFGEDVVPCSYEDLDCADLIVLVGSNTAWCHPVIWQRIEKARERRGTRIVVVDPRRTETAERADLHLAVALDGDIALFNALLAEMRERGLLDEGFLRERCEVPEGFWDILPPPLQGRGPGGGADKDDSPHPNPSPGSEAGPEGQREGLLGGIPEAQFRAFADLVAERPRMVTVFSQGANQSACGTDKGNAIINFHLATGRINRPGTGPFSMTGQPNAMGGREVGGLATMLASHLGFSEAERADVAAFWQTERLCAGPGLKAVDMFRAVHEGRIRFLWVMATNPAVSMPNAGLVREALARCETLVVSDAIADTDTARFAHVRLPALAWGEKDGTVTNSERVVSRQRALFAPPGEARADWRIVADVAARLGYPEQFAWRRPAEVFGEYAAMTALSVRHGKVLDLTEWARSPLEYDAMQPFQWGGAHPLAKRFPTPDGKARLVPVSPPEAPEPADELPLRLNTGRYRDQWHTMTRTGLSPRLSIHRREPLLELHPDDASEARVEDGGLARVATADGDSVFRVAVTDAQRRGEAFVPMHWTDAMSGGGRTGRLVHDVRDPHSGQPAFKNVPARVEPVRSEWRALLVCREPVAPGAAYWSRARIAGGWLYEIEGEGETPLDALLPHGTRGEVSDGARGMRRICVTDEEGRLAAALYLTRSGKLPARDWVERQFAAQDASPLEFLAGRPAVPLPDRGPTVCLCHDVGEREVVEAAAAGACSVDAVGAATRAGTNCGSCRPLIARLLAEAESTMEAAE